MSGLLLPLVLALPLLGCLVLLAAGPVRGARVAASLGVAVSAAVLGLTLLLAAVFDRGAPGPQLVVDQPWVPALGLRFHLGVDGVSLPLVLLTALLSFLGLLYTVHHLPSPGRVRAFVALQLLLEAGVLGTFLALDLLLFFVAFEVVLVPMYVLVAVWGGAGRAAAARKFILYTLLGSVVMLVGFLLLYSQAGTTDLTVLAARAGAGTSAAAQLAVFVLVGVGLAVKAPMWPLHTWLPDAHTEAPTVGSVLLAGVLLKMGTYGFVRIAVPAVPEGARLAAPYLAALAVVGILYGGLACLAQRDLKRLVAYSSVGHMGFVLLGVASLSPAGLNGALFANVAHGLVTGLLFFLAGAVQDRHGTGDLAALGRGLYARAPVLGGLLAFGAVASLGLPGLAGFWGEMLALLGAFRPGPGLARPAYLTLMVLAGLGTVLAAAYLLRLVRRVCQGPSGAAWTGRPVAAVTRWELAVWAPLVALTVLVGLWPGLLLDLTDPAVGPLVGGLR